MFMVHEGRETTRQCALFNLCFGCGGFTATECVTFSMHVYDQVLDGRVGASEAITRGAFLITKVGDGPD